MVYSFLTHARSKHHSLDSFLESEIQRHFESWRCELSEAKFDLSWVGEHLVLSTENPGLVHK